jgi:hypothetical protein
MSEEHLRVLEALGALAREEEVELGELEALCRPAQRAQALQRARGSSDADEKATQPLSAESQARIVQRVQEALRAINLPQQPLRSTAPPANENAVALADAALPTVKRKRPSARAQPRRVEPKAAPKPLRTWVSVALPLLAAAAAVLLWLEPAPELVALPDYSLDARASSTYRGEPAAQPDGPVAIPQGGSLELELRPETEYPGQLELRVQLQRTGEAVDIPAQVEQSPQGSVRVHVERASLPVRGTARLLITLAQPEAQPLLAARDPSALHGKGWQAWLLEIALP